MEARLGDHPTAVDNGERARAAHAAPDGRAAVVPENAPVLGGAGVAHIQSGVLGVVPRIAVDGGGMGIHQPAVDDDGARALVVVAAEGRPVVASFQPQAPDGGNAGHIGPLLLQHRERIARLHLRAVGKGGVRGHNTALGGYHAARRVLVAHRVVDDEDVPLAAAQGRGARAHDGLHPLPQDVVAVGREREMHLGLVHDLVTRGGRRARRRALQIGEERHRRVGAAGLDAHAAEGEVGLGAGVHLDLLARELIARAGSADRERRGTRDVQVSRAVGVPVALLRLCRGSARTALHLQGRGARPRGHPASLIGLGAGQGQRGGLGPHHHSGHIERQRRACARDIRRAPGAAGIGRSRKGRAVLRPFGEKRLRSRGPLPG